MVTTRPASRDFSSKILEHVAYYLLPEELLQAAIINKHWFAVFTSDEVWRDWNAHNIKRRIYKHYLRMKRKTCSGDRKEDEWGEYVIPPNWYNVLAHARAVGENPFDDLDLDCYDDDEYRQQTVAASMLLSAGLCNMAKASQAWWDLLHARPLGDQIGIWDLVGCKQAKFWGKDLAYYYLRAGAKPSGLHLVKETNLQSDPEAALYYLGKDGFYNGRRSKNKSSTFNVYFRSTKDELFKVPGFIEEALKFAPELYFESLPAELQQNLEYFDIAVAELSRDPPFGMVRNVQVDTNNFTMFSTIVQDEPRLRALLKACPVFWIPYVKECTKLGRLPDVAMVRTALETGCYFDEDCCYFDETLTLEFHCLPSNPPQELFHDKQGTIGLFSDFDCAQWWDLLPEHLKVDPDMLRVMLSKLAERGTSEGDITFKPQIERSVLWLEILATCEHPIDPDEEMDVLLQIMQSPTLDMAGVPANKSKSYRSDIVDEEDLAAQMFKSVGVDYASRTQTKKRRVS